MKALSHTTPCEGEFKNCNKQERREINAVPKGKTGRNSSILNRPLSRQWWYGNEADASLDPRNLRCLSYSSSNLWYLWGFSHLLDMTQSNCVMCFPWQITFLRLTSTLTWRLHLCMGAMSLCKITCQTSLQDFFSVVAWFSGRIPKQLQSMLPMPILWHLKCDRNHNDFCL